MKNDGLLTKIEETFSKDSNVKKLLTDTCHIISESGNYSLCWIGIMNETTNWMEPISECISKTEYLDAINLTLNPGFPAGILFSVGNYYVNNNIDDDLLFKGWWDNPVLSRFKSITIFPLIQNLKTIGAVYLYSDVKGFFKHDELLLLQILSMNLSLALDNLQSDEFEIAPKPDLSEKIQELKKQNEKLLINREKADEINRLKASFLTSMGHKLRTPLNSIIGFAEFLSKSDNTDAERQEYSRLIVNQSNVLLQNINNILQISKLDTRTVHLYKETVSINNLLDDLHKIYLNKLESINKKEIELICRKLPGDGDFELTTDVSKLRQIFINLLDNSVKFTDKGEISFGYYSHNLVDFCCFVSDTGIGINTEDLKYFFDIFKQSDEVSSRSYGETGLGLAICKENAQLLGGDIWALSPHDKGTTFYFTLKYASKEIKSASVKSINKNLHWTTHEILIIEDDSCTIQYLTKILEQGGFKISVAHDKKEAENLFQKLSEIDLVLLDMSLPDVSGLDLAKQIKIIRKDIPVIAQTALTIEDNGKQFLDAGCDGYITKPYRRDQVLSAINTYISA